MAYNPFLSMNEPTVPDSTEELNPFMMADLESSTFTPGDNPFATSNPFSDFEVEYEPPVGDTVPMDIFGNESISIGAKQFDESPSLNIFGNQPIENEPLMKPKDLELVSTIIDCSYINEEQNQRAEPPARPLPPETQNLILSVTGQMEFTSSHLLDRIPPTRTPSPVSVRDIHSPSPTPDQDFFGEPAVVDTLEITRNKPVRPPPARPPRPAPPPRPQQAPAITPTNQPPAEDINLFDAPIPVVNKPTKEDILSLYSAPKKVEHQIDFLSDDIPEMPAEAEMQPSSFETSLKIPESSNLFFTETDADSSIADPVNTNEMLTSTSQIPDDSTETPMDCSEAVVDPAPALTTGSPFALESGDVQQAELSYDDNDVINPFENTAVEDDTENIGEVAMQPENTFELKSTEIPCSLGNDASHVTPDAHAAQDNIFASAPTHAFQDQINAFNMDRADVSVDPPKSLADNTEWGDTENMVQDAFLESQSAFTVSQDAFAESQDAFTESQDAFPESQDAFDAFSAKFDSAGGNHMNTDAWGVDASGEAEAGGFEAEAFDPFLSLDAPPAPAATPRLDHQGSGESTDDTFSVFIRPKDSAAAEAAVPALAPPPAPPRPPVPDAARLNPFDKTAEPVQERPLPLDTSADSAGRDGSETPPTPLFDEDVSVPLEDFPRTKYLGPGWEMHLRQPNKKKITGQRFWKKVFVRLAQQGDGTVVQLLNAAGDREPLQELPLQACYSVSEIGAQQFDQFGKIFTVKLQYVFYKERPGVRPGQVTKAERLTNKLSQFAAYAIQGDYQGVKEFGSDLRKLGLPFEHAPQVSQLFKIGSLSYEDMKQFSCCVEEALFRVPAHRDRALTYKAEEVQITAVDELYVEQAAEGAVLKQIARVRLFFLGFLSGMPDIELGVNDLRRQGREVVGRHDIVPGATEEWIRVEDHEVHACVQPGHFEETQIIKFKPPDACYIELMRFRVRPPKNRELPLLLKAVWCVNGNKVELRGDVLVPGFASRRLGQVPCEDVAIRIPIPECWIYLFRVEKHFRYGSVKSAHRRTGKVKGIERFLGAVDTLQESLIEVTSGQAKYEHQHRAIVWRMPRLPKEGQGAYTTHNMVCRMALTSYDQVPAELAQWAHVEFTMPATQVSHVTVRSVSMVDHDGDPPEKCVRYLARHEYKVGIERTSGEQLPMYSLAAQHAPPAAEAPPPAPVAAAPAPPSSDSDSD